jgi:YVTN family beta-propeller protein
MNKVTATISVGISIPVIVAITPDGTRAYVANMAGNESNVCIIATATNQITAVIPIPFGLFAIAMTPDGTKVYVVNNPSGSVQVIETATNQVTATIKVRGYPIDGAIAPDGTRFYAFSGGSSGGSSIDVIDTATDQVMTNILVDGEAMVFATVPVQTNGCSNCAESMAATREAKQSITLRG